jgi:hypothetical protein
MEHEPTDHSAESADTNETAEQPKPPIRSADDLLTPEQRAAQVAFGLELHAAWSRALVDPVITDNKLAESPEGQ